MDLVKPFAVTNTAGFRSLVKDFKGRVVCECDCADYANFVCRMLNGTMEPVQELREAPLNP